MLESKILETRLINKESSFVGSSVSKCASRFKTLISNKTKLLELELKSIIPSSADSLSKSPDKTASSNVTITNVKLPTSQIQSKESITKDLNISLENYVRELVQYKLDINKVSSIEKSYVNQVSCYNTIENEIRSKILSTENDIKNLEKKFINEKLIRLHREQLEMKAMEVNKLPSKQFLKRKINDIESSIISIESDIQLADSKIMARNKQFHALLESINDLQNKLPMIEETEQGGGSGSGGMNINSNNTVTGVDGLNNEEEEEEVRDRESEEIDNARSRHSSTMMNSSRSHHNDSEQHEHEHEREGEGEQQLTSDTRTPEDDEEEGAVQEDR